MNNNYNFTVCVMKAKSQKRISNNIQKNKPSTRTELLYLRGYPKHRYVQQAASARYGPSCKSGINVNE